MNLDKRLLRQVQSARGELFLTIRLGVLGRVILVFQALALSRIVDRVFLNGANLTDVQRQILTLLALAVFRAAVTWTAKVTANRVAGRVKSQLRKQLTTHLLRLGPNYTQGERSGELANTVTEGVEALDAYLSQYLPQLALAALVPLAILIFVFPLDLLSGLVLLVTAPLIPFFMMLIGNAAKALTRKQWQTLSRMSAHFLDVLQGLTTLKILGRSREQIQTIAEISDRFRQTTMEVLRIAFLSALVLEMLATISTAVVAVQIGLRLLYGHLDFESAFFVLLLAPEFYLPLRMLGTHFHAGSAGVAAARRIFEILEADPHPASHPTRLPGFVPPLAGEMDKGGIHFKNVCYSYDHGQRPALHDFSLTIEPGQLVALVGPSGAGKSTVANLLLRFIEPQAGQISMGDKPLRKVSPGSWREQVAWVPQNPYLFNASVRENLLLARPKAGHDQIIRAARLAHAPDFVQALPNGYDTVIGERGARLSGGQLQRIALARAFLKDAPFLLLDEATANLDPLYEQLIQESIRKLLHGRTSLIIAHRLHTITRADHIVVMDKGQIAESGPFEQLMAQEGLFRRLVSNYQSPMGQDQWTNGR